MKAVIHDKKHKPSRLRIGDVDKPSPEENEVLIEVHSSSINAADYRSLQLRITPKKKIFGAAVAGKVVSVGNSISQFQTGDEVVGDVSDFGFGGFAEYAVAPEKALTLKPSTVSFEEAATLPVAATTALKALRDKGNIKNGQKVLIVGSSGGVGTFALQLAKYYGAIVTAVCSTKNIEQSKTLGADFIIDYSKESFTKNKECYDLIIAVNGSYSLFGYRKSLSSAGTYVMVGGSMWQILKSILFGWMLSFGKKKMRVLTAKSDPMDLEIVTKLLAEGKITAPIERRISLDDVPEEMTGISTGHASGKVIINLR